MKPKKPKLKPKTKTKPARPLFYAFALNEYRYKHLCFTVHHKQQAAEKSAYRPYRGSAYSDYAAEVIEGKDAFVKWAKECNYTIDWEKRTLTHADANA